MKTENMKKPTKIVCAGLNYIDHAKEMNMTVPSEPVIFMKPVSSLIGNKEKIILPEMSQRVDYEAELAVIINKKCKSVKPEDIGNYIEGYTCLNDVSARDLQKRDGQWTRAKSFDTFCPVGPKIVKKINPEVECYNIFDLESLNNFVENYECKFLSTKNI